MQARQRVLVSGRIEVDKAPECQYRFFIHQINMLAAGKTKGVLQEAAKKPLGGFGRRQAAFAELRGGQQAVIQITQGLYALLFASAGPGNNGAGPAGRTSLPYRRYHQAGESPGNPPAGTVFVTLRFRVFAAQNQK